MKPAIQLPPGLSWRAEFAPQDPKTTEAPRQVSTETGTTANPGGPTTGEPQQQEACGTEMWWMMGAMFLVMYFLLIRPQKKQEKELKSMRDGLKRGDKVVTTGGMHGTITEMTDTSITLRTDQDGRTKMTFDLSAIGRTLQSESEEGKTT